MNLIKGSRVQLIAPMQFESFLQAHIPSGMVGVVTKIQKHSVDVDWENGSKRALAIPEDKFVIVDEYAGMHLPEMECANGCGRYIRIVHTIVCDTCVAKQKAATLFGNLCIS